VKKSEDLLAVRSDCYLIRDEKLVVNPDRKIQSIRINLDPKFFGRIDQFDNRFKEGVPSLVECESMTIHGDVLFEKNVRIKGNVVITNMGNTQAIIKKNTVIDGDIIF
jgi:UTP--glucose-1-phosphate uridylyltransferase